MLRIASLSKPLACAQNEQ